MNSQTVEPEMLLGQLNEVEKKFALSVLYYKGNLDHVRTFPTVSVIGARKASPEGILRTNKLVKKLVDKSIVIVSGLAEGIDTAAHTSCIKLGGKTIGVIGTPLDAYYPKQNKELQNEIATNHLLLSQFEFGNVVKPQNFPMRNKTMALISKATIIIEAKEKSGCLYQATEALRLGRELYITKSCVDDLSLTWPSKMLNSGAKVLTENSLDLLLECLTIKNKNLLQESSPNSLCYNSHK